MHRQWVGTIHRGVVQTDQREKVKALWLVISSKNMENFWHWLKMSFNMHIRWIRVPLGQLATAKLYKAKSDLKAKIICRWILPFHEQLEKPLFLGRTMKHTGHVSCFWKCAKSISHCDVQVSKVRKNDKDGTCARLHLLSTFTETSTTCAWSLTNPAGTMRLQMTHLWLPKLMSILAESNLWCILGHFPSGHQQLLVDRYGRPKRAAAIPEEMRGVDPQNGTGRHGCLSWAVW